ncbi:hypothetical protein ACU6TU_09755 [Halomonas sp. LS-001]
MQRFTRPLLTLLLAVFSHTALADPTAFGLTLGASSEAEMKAQYRVEHTGVNRYSDGNTYEIPAHQVAFNGLKKLTAIFDEDEVLVALLATFHKNRFDDLNQAIGQKYRRVNQQIPFVGNKKASFRDGDTQIILDAPHLSFELTLSYLRDNFNTAFNQRSQQEQRQRREQEASQL